MNLVIQGQDVGTPDLKALATIARGEAIERISEDMELASEEVLDWLHK